MAYTKNQLVEAMYDCWHLLRELEQEPDDNHMAKSPKLVALQEKHPCLAELDESGPNGWAGIGLGNMGGHAI
jgi:hypothetical protein